MNTINIVNALKKPAIEIAGLKLTFAYIMKK